MRVVEDRLADVSGSLDVATCGTALCRVDGAGGGAKALERRMAALLEARRVLRADPEADLAAVARRGQADLDSRTARGSSRAWIEYLAGGVAELESLMGEPSW